jgi:hypothetical protein
MGLNTLFLIFETVLFAAAIIFCALWIRWPTEPFEPLIAFCTICLGVIEILRRSSNAKDKEVVFAQFPPKLRARDAHELEKPVTVCKECQHFINLEPDSPRADVWYNHLCGASPLPKKTDPLDGKLKPYHVNDLGGEYFSEHELHYCRDINDGACLKFTMKPAPER